MLAAPSGPPVNVVATVTGLSVQITWEDAPVGTGVLVSYTLFCSVIDDEVLRAVLKPIQEFSLEELNPSTSYVCGLFGSTSGGDGPSASFSFTTEGLTNILYNKQIFLWWSCFKMSEVPYMIFPTGITSSVVILPFIVMDSLFGVEETIFPESDEGINGPLPSDIGFPFGSSVQTQIYVSLLHKYVLDIQLYIIYCRWEQMESFHLALHMVRSSINHSQGVGQSIFGI